MADSADESTWDDAARLAALRALPAFGSLDALFRDDGTLRRFLRARKGDETAALAALVAHQDWRRTTTPRWPAATVPLEAVRADVLVGKAYAHGRDREGRPLSWIRVRLHDRNEDRAQIAAFLALMLDEALARCECAPHNAEKFSMLIDFDAFGVSNFDVDTATLLIRTLIANFPERLGRLYFVRESWLFWALWRVISVFIDERSAKKIVFLGHDFMPALLEDIDASQIPAWLGGASEYEYSPQHVFDSVDASATSANNPNTYLSLSRGPRGHLPWIEGSAFDQGPRR